MPDLINDLQMHKVDCNSKDKLYGIFYKDIDLDRSVFIEVEGDENFRKIFRWGSTQDWLELSFVQVENSKKTDFVTLNPKQYPSLRGKIAPLELSDIMKYVSGMQRI